MKKVLILVVLGLVIALVGCNTETIDFAQNSSFSLKSIVTKIDTSITGSSFLVDSVYVSWAIQTPTQGEGLALFKSQDTTNFPADPETTYIYGRINSYTDVTDVNPLETYFYRITLPTNSETAIVYTLEANMRDTIQFLSPIPSVDTNFAYSYMPDTIMIIPETLKIQFKTIPDVYQYSVDFGYIDTTGVYKLIWTRQNISVPDTSDTLPYTTGTDDPVVYDTLGGDTLFTFNFTGADDTQTEYIIHPNTKYLVRVNAIYENEPVTDPNVLSLIVNNKSIGWTSFKTAP
ncbi:hypothetical protein KAU43_06895 [candidate division WOR-3 bacterium]|nr:hypothetical protein [candidate division WOR-3 bacterium]